MQNIPDFASVGFLMAMPSGPLRHILSALTLTRRVAAHAKTLFCHFVTISLSTSASGVLERLSFFAPHPTHL